MPARTRASIADVDPQAIPFRYDLTGCVNGAPAGLRIEGSVARREVRFEIEVTPPGEPLLWDEQILALAAIDPIVLLSMGSDTTRRDSAPEIFRVESGLFDDGEKAVGRLVLSGCWSFEDGKIVVRAQLVEGWMNFEPMERVTQVAASSPMSVLATEAGNVVTTRTWAVETSRGNSYSGASIMRGRFLPFARGLRDHVVGVRWTTVAGDGPAHRTYSVAVEEHGGP